MSKFTFENDARLILSDGYGVYIPQLYCSDITEAECEKLSISWDDVQCCQKGPSDDDGKPNEWYWEAWSSIENNLEFTDDHGQVWRIYQNGDLWEVPAGCEIPEW